MSIHTWGLSSLHFRDATKIHKCSLPLHHCRKMDEPPNLKVGDTMKCWKPKSDLNQGKHKWHFKSNKSIKVDPSRKQNLEEKGDSEIFVSFLPSTYTHGLNEVKVNMCMINDKSLVIKFLLLWYRKHSFY